MIPMPSLPGLDTPSTRRVFLGQAAALAAVALLPRAAEAATAIRKPNSIINGVRIGTISYSYRSALTSAEELLQAEVARLEKPRAAEPERDGSGLAGPAYTAEQQAAIESAESERRLRAAMEKRDNG